MWHYIQMSELSDYLVLVTPIGTIIGIHTNLALLWSTLLTLLNPSITAGPRQEPVPAH